MPNPNPISNPNPNPNPDPNPTPNPSASPNPNPNPDPEYSCQQVQQIPLATPSLAAENTYQPTVGLGLGSEFQRTIPTTQSPVQRQVRDLKSIRIRGSTQGGGKPVSVIVRPCVRRENRERSGDRIRVDVLRGFKKAPPDQVGLGLGLRLVEDWSPV